MKHFEGVFTIGFIQVINLVHFYSVFIEYLTAIGKLPLYITKHLRINRPLSLMINI